MTTYMDQIHRVWLKVHNPQPGKEWMLLTDTADEPPKPFEAGHYYSTLTLARHNIILHAYQKSNDQYEFPVAYQSGQQVWIDMDWLYDNAVDYMEDYIGSPQRIGGKVIKQSDYSDTVTVSVQVTVPITKVTKK